MGQVTQKSSTNSSRIEFGREGEDLATAWLVGHGFSILQRNWRHHRYEVDIIAGRGNTIHFIEVKTRRSLVYGNPEESVSRKKIEHMMQGAAGWLCRTTDYRRVQYDVLAIVYPKKNSQDAKKNGHDAVKNGQDAENNPPEIVLFEDVYL